MNLKVITNVEAANDPDLSKAANWFIRNIIGLNNQEVLKLSEEVGTADEGADNKDSENVNSKKRK